jgi:hypothetical protein
MSESIKQRINAARLDGQTGKELRALFEAIFDDLTNGQTGFTNIIADTRYAMLSAPTLAIGGGAKQTAQATKPFMANVGGTMVFKAAATAMSAITGNIATGKFGLWAWYIDSAGAITTSTKTADADTAAAAFALMPAVPSGKVQIGAMIVTNSAGQFTGGTTALDAASTTVIYIDTIGAMAQVSSAVAHLNLAE